jgi:hypothetical protein
MQQQQQQAHQWQRQPEQQQLMAFEDRYNRAQFPFTPGVPVVFNLNKGLNVLKGNIIITGTLTITNAGAAGTPIGEPTQAIINLIRRIRVIGNRAAGSRYPNGALVDCSPQSLLRYATVERQGKFSGELLGVGALGGGVAGAYTFYISIPIYFGDTLNNNNVQTALNMNPLDSQGNPIYTAVQVQIDCAALLTELFSGSGGTMVVAAMVQWKDDRLGLSTDTVPLVQEDHYALIQAPNERFVDPQMPTDGFFNQWLVLAQQNVPGLALSNALINRLEILGSSLNYKEEALDIQQAMLDDGLWDASQSMTGQYFLDWTKGVLGNSNAAAGLQHKFSINNPSGAGNDRLRIYTRRIFPLAA